MGGKDRIEKYEEDLRIGGNQSGQERWLTLAGCVLALALGCAPGNSPQPSVPQDLLIPSHVNQVLCQVAETEHTHSLSS